jgi:hypothetical protein
MPADRDKLRRDVGIPIRPFMYTLDQVADMLNVPVPKLKRQYCYFEDIHTTAKPTSKMRVRNINPDQGEEKDWRIAESELYRWLKHMGFRVIERRSLRE